MRPAFHCLHYNLVIKAAQFPWPLSVGKRDICLMLLGEDAKALPLFHIRSTLLQTPTVKILQQDQKLF